MPHFAERHLSQRVMDTAQLVQLAISNFQSHLFHITIGKSAANAPERAFFIHFFSNSKRVICVCMAIVARGWRG
jgi:hypothetical protein